MASKKTNYTRISVSLALSLLTVGAYAVTEADTFSDMATNLSSQFTAIGQLMTGTAYIAGIGFGISAIFKFKQHKDNPTQVPVGTPLTMLAISAALMFMGNFIQPLGETLFGGGDVARAGTTSSGFQSGFGGSSGSSDGGASGG